MNTDKETLLSIMDIIRAAKWLLTTQIEPLARFGQKYKPNTYQMLSKLIFQKPVLDKSDSVIRSKFEPSRIYVFSR